jgi:hypothetical protein
MTEAQAEKIGRAWIKAKRRGDVRRSTEILERFKKAADAPDRTDAKSGAALVSRKKADLHEAFKRGAKEGLSNGA